MRIFFYIWLMFKNESLFLSAIDPRRPSAFSWWHKMNDTCVDVSGSPTALPTRGPKRPSSAVLALCCESITCITREALCPLFLGETRGVRGVSEVERKAEQGERRIRHSQPPPPPSPLTTEKNEQNLCTQKTSLDGLLHIEHTCWGEGGTSLQLPSHHSEAVAQTTVDGTYHKEKRCEKRNI